MPAADDEGPDSRATSEHVVQQGECMSSIAEGSGHFWKRLWNDPANAALKEARRDPNVLLAGDRVIIPAIVVKEVDAATGRRHSFRRRGVPSYLRVRFVKGDGEPRANEAYTLRIDGVESKGALDGDGWLVVPVPPRARKGELELASGLAFTMDLGFIDPIDTPGGVRARLDNLGYDCGDADGSGADLLPGALRAFQADSGLAETGVADDGTRQALASRYGA